MKFTLTETLFLLEFLKEELTESVCLTEESRSGTLTPYQKAQMARRQTVAAHTPRPAKQSAFYKHAVRAIFNKLRRTGESFRGAAKGGQLIAQYMLKKHGYATGHPSGGFSLTSKGKTRNLKHTKEPRSVYDKKSRAYDHIMGVQRRQKQVQQNLQAKAKSAG